MLALDPDFVAQWADRYESDELGDRERSLLTKDEPRIRERGPCDPGRTDEDRPLGVEPDQRIHPAQRP